MKMPTNIFSANIPFSLFDSQSYPWIQMLSSCNSNPDDSQSLACVEVKYEVPETLLEESFTLSLQR
jgi:hypothetical protein